MNNSPLARGDDGEEAGGGRREDEKTTADLPTMHQRSSSHLGLAGIVVTKTTTITTTSSATTIPTNGQTHGRGRGSDDMTLDELSSNKKGYQDGNASTQSPRVPSPDIATILSITPRPALSLSRSRSGDTNSRSQSRSKSRAPAGQRRVVSATNPEYHHPHSINLNRRQSESASTANVPAHDRLSSSELAYLHNVANGLPPPSTTKKTSLSRSTSVVSGYHDQEIEDYDEALERVLEGGGSEDEGAGVGVVWDGAVKNNRRGRRSRGNVVQEEGGGGDSDSSLDLHTPLPYVFVFSLLSLTNSPHF